MSFNSPTLDTDAAWEQWGRRDPYFGVLTNPKFRRREMTEQDRNEFFETGRLHVDYLLHVIRNRLDANFKPRTILDFGCGVGRTLVSFAQCADEVVGLDVSPSMLAEAEHNCHERGLSNVRLVPSDDALSFITQPFDMIHSCIVFQHIPLERGRLVFRRLLKLLSPGGIGAVQFLYSKALYADNFGIPANPVDGAREPPHKTRPDADPEIQMNPYNMNEILFLMQTANVRRFCADFTDHGGELGVFLFFQLS
jgi:SAM-dependent methyltransferase